MTEPKVPLAERRYRLGPFLMILTPLVGLVAVVVSLALLLVHALWTVTP